MVAANFVTLDKKRLNPCHAENFYVQHFSPIVILFNS